MFDRFTDRARKVMSIARDEARRLNHVFIGSEHILFGLVEERTTVAAQVLQGLDVEPAKVRRELDKLAKSVRSSAASDRLPFSMRATDVLAFALEEASDLGHNYIGTEHVLLGLIREHEGKAAAILAELHVDPAAVRRDVLKFLGVIPVDEAQDPRERRLEPASFTPQARAAVEAAKYVARVGTNPFITTDQLLTGLMLEGRGVAAKVLAKLGVTIKIVEEEAATFRELEPA